MNVNVGDEFRYISEIPAHSFDFYVFGVRTDSLNIIVNRDSENLSIHKLKMSEIEKCTKITVKG